MFNNLNKSLSKRKSPQASAPNRVGVVDASKCTSRTGLASPASHKPSLSSNYSSTRRPNSSSPPMAPPKEPPPAYTATPGRSLNKAGPQRIVASTDSDPYAFLKFFDTILVVDDSGSMAGRSWRDTRVALETITPTCTGRDAGGIDIYFLNEKDSPLYKNITRASTVGKIFELVHPSGATPTGQRLDKILRPYLQRYQAAPEITKPINVIVITDGEPSDDVESVIISAARKLDKLEAPPWQVGIQFFQIGREPSAREHLQYLHDGLRELAGNDKLRDIVDTVPFMGDGGSTLTATRILKVVLGSVNRRLNRSSRELHRCV